MIRNYFHFIKLTRHTQLEDHVVPVGVEANVAHVGEVVVVGEYVLVAVVRVVGVVLLQLRVDLGVGEDVAAGYAVLVRALAVAVPVLVRVPGEDFKGLSTCLSKKM